jgi:formate/nitrite transporter FocA (FNT family)
VASLIAKLGYSFGFVLVVLGRQQLFTENTLTPILPLLDRKDRVTFWNVLRLWGIVLAANLIGAVAIAWVLGNTQAFEPEVRRSFGDIGREAIRTGFGLAVLRGIFAGWLIAFMVWLLPFAESPRRAQPSGPKLPSGISCRHSLGIFSAESLWWPR